MKKLLLLPLFCVLFAAAGAQRVYFIYLQTDNGAPFFVRMGDKVFSSTAAGYLILSNLRDSSYTFNLGFPGNTISEGLFTIPIAGRDKGFGVKYIDGAMSLFDLQTLSLIKSGSRTGGTSVKTVENPDAFTRTLSRASNDPSLLQVQEPVGPVQTAAPDPKPAAAVTISSDAAKIAAVAVDTVILQQPSKRTIEEEKAVEAPPVVVQKTEPAPDSVHTNPVAATPAVPDSAIVKKAEVAATQTAANSITDNTTITQPSTQQTTITAAETTQPFATPAFVRTKVVQRSESSTTQGFGLVYLDHTPEGVDTIRLLIPNTRFVSLENPAAESNTKQANETNHPVSVSSEKKESAAPVQNEITPSQPAPTPEKNVVKTSCRYDASEADFIRLRRNMAARPSEEAMVTEARKAFKVRCYPTDYLRKLSGMFLYEEAKYAFLELAYNHVSDPQNFASLQTEFKDTYYLNRFKALVADR